MAVFRSCGRGLGQGPAAASPTAAAADCGLSLVYHACWALSGACISTWLRALAHRARLEGGPQFLWATMPGLGASFGSALAAGGWRRAGPLGLQAPHRGFQALLGVWA